MTLTTIIQLRCTLTKPKYLNFVMDLIKTQFIRYSYFIVILKEISVFLLLRYILDTDFSRYCMRLDNGPKIRLDLISLLELELSHDYNWNNKIIICSINMFLLLINHPTT